MLSPSYVPPAGGYEQRHSIGNGARARALRMGELLGALLLMHIPIAGMIIAICWACGLTENKAKQSLAQALLIFWAIVAVVCILLLWSLFSAGSLLLRLGGWPYAYGGGWPGFPDVPNDWDNWEGWDDWEDWDNWDGRYFPYEYFEHFDGHFSGVDLPAGILVKESFC